MVRLHRDSPTLIAKIGIMVKEDEIFREEVWRSLRTISNDPCQLLTVYLMKYKVSKSISAVHKDYMSQVMS